MEEGFIQQIFQLFQDLLQKHLYRIKFSENYINNLVQKFISTISDDQIKNLNPYELERKAKTYLKNTFVRIAFRNPDYKIAKAFVDKYLFIYEDVMQLPSWEDCKENKFLFIDILFFLLFQYDKYHNIDVLLKNTFLNELRKRKKNIPNQKSEKHAEKKEEPTIEKCLLEQSFIGDKKVLRTVISAFSLEEREYIRRIKRKEDIKDPIYYDELLIEINQAMRYYFLLKWNGYNEAEIATELSCERRKEFPKKDLEVLQEQFYKSFLLPSNLVKQHADSLNKKIIQIFLGNRDYDISGSQKVIINCALAWKNEENRKFKEYKKQYSIFHRFSFERERVVLIFHCLKNEAPELYEVLKKYHGENLNILNIPNEVDLDLYEKAIETICLISKQEEDGKVIIDSTDFLILKKNEMDSHLSETQILPEEEKKQDQEQIDHSNVKKTKRIVYTNKKLMGIFCCFPEIESMSKEDKTAYMDRIFSKFKLLKTIKLEYYKIIKKRNGESLLEWNKLTRKEQVLYYSAINKLRKMVRFDKKYKAEECLNGIFHLFLEMEGMTDEDKTTYKERIYSCFKLLEAIKPKYYEIIKKRNGENLLEWNSLTRKEQFLYYNAIDKLKCIVRFEKNSFFDHFSEMHDMSKEEKEKFIVILKKTVLLLKLLYPPFYEVIIKCRGIDLAEDNAIKDKEFIVYLKAIEEIKKINTCGYFYVSTMLVKNSLLNQKKFLSCVKLRRRNASSIDISRQLNITLENLYLIYAHSLLLFGEMTFEIIEEILQNSKNAILYLNYSSHFKFILSNLPDEGKEYYQTLLNQSGIDFARIKSLDE